MLAANQRIWGFETNFGGLADLAVVKANQLMPKPAHLSWEEAAINALCNSTAYRMLVSPQRRRDEAGRHASWCGAPPAASAATPSSTSSTAAAPRSASCPRPTRWPCSTSSASRPSSTAGPPATGSGRDEHTQDESEWRRFGKDIRSLVGDDPDIVFEHPGRQTMGASVFACKRAGTIVTCAATSGYMIEYDNRHLWMKLKTIKGSHFANYREAWDANQLICQGKVVPPLSAVYPLEEVGEAAYQVHQQPPRGQDRRPVPRPAGGPRHRRPRAAGQGRRGADHLVPAARRMSATPARHAHRDRPRGHRRPRPRRGHRLLPRHLRGRGGPSGADRVRRGRGGTDQGGRLLRPAAQPRPGRTRPWPSSSRTRARASITWATGSTTAPRRSHAVRRRGRQGHRRGAPARVARHHRRLRPPQGRRSAR